MGVDPLLGADQKWIRSRSGVDPLCIQSLWLAQTDHMEADPFLGADQERIGSGSLSHVIEETDLIG